MPILRRFDRGYWHWCPACEDTHPLWDSWKFDGNTDKPTFTPSFAQGFVRWTGGVDDRGLGRGEKQNLTCHYFITDGNIQFCPDSWHGRSDIVVMPPLPEPKDRFGHETQD